MSDRVHNHLRAYRKRAGLSQDELAFLLGCKNGTKVSRYERLERRPTLETILAYEVVLGVHARDLFAALYRQVEADTKPRVQLLLHKVSDSNPGPLTARKLQTLQTAAFGGLTESAREA